MFNTEPAAQALSYYPVDAEPFDRTGAMLFRAWYPLDRPRFDRELVRAAGRAHEGRFLDVNERAYPGDFATFARYQPALEDFLPSRGPLLPLSLAELAVFVSERGSPGLAWEDLERHLPVDHPARGRQVAPLQGQPNCRRRRTERHSKQAREAVYFSRGSASDSPALTCRPARVAWMASSRVRAALRTSSWIAWSRSSSSWLVA